MLARVPLLEGASIAALLSALAAFAHAREATASGATAAAIAIATPMIARWIARQSTRPDGIKGVPSLAIAGSAIASSTLALGIFAPSGFCRVRALGVGLSVGSIFALQARSVMLPGAWIAAVFTGLAAFVGALDPRSALSALPVGLLAAALLVGGARLLIAASADERTRRTYELSGLFAATFLLAMAGVYSAHSFSHSVGALGSLALAIAMAFAHTALAPLEAVRVARMTAALAAGIVAASLVTDPSDALVWPVSVAALVTMAVDRLGLSLTSAMPSARLAAASRAAIEALAGQESVEDVARAALDPLRDPKDVRVTGELWLIDECKRATLDVAGTVRWSDLAIESERALLSWLRARAEEVAFADAMRELAEERADAPAVLSALHGREAFCAVGGYVGGVLSTVLFVPRAGRREPPAWEEREALRALGRRIASAVESARALESARRRAAEAEKVARDAEEARKNAVERCDLAEGRVARAPNIVRLAGTLETVWVGYSAPMRALDQRLRGCAKTREVLAIVCGQGGPRESVLWRLHGYSAASLAPCAAIDASRVHPRDAIAALFGTSAQGEGDSRVEAQAGVIELAGQGTLGIFDAQALGPEALSALAIALRDGRASRLGASESYAIHARVVLFLRENPVASGLPAELCEALGHDWITVPSLAARSEDIEARVLLAIDRACRALGREPIGIGRDAMEALRAWPFPGDDRELDEAIERASITAVGRITVEDLPSPIGRSRASSSNAPKPTAAADAETFDALERRILEAALERAGGNKSEAARALGLARTTFLDKLRKYGLRE
ncbi:MAG: helix-turn-helix domain-containing protein [Polyangiales bacterium]